MFHVDTEYELDLRAGVLYGCHVLLQWLHPACVSVAGGACGDAARGQAARFSGIVGCGGGVIAGKCCLCSQNTVFSSACVVAGPLTRVS